MPDLLVKLYDLPDARPVMPKGVRIRPVMAAEVTRVATMIEGAFGRGWADEFVRGAHMAPVGSLIAIKDNHPIGFACFDATAPGLFGPTGVVETHRGEGVGAALLFAALDGLLAKGYPYAVIGGAGPVAFYEKLVGAVIIPDSDKRYLNDMLR